MAIRFENESWKVLAADYHPGQGKMGGVSHVRLLNLQTGTQWEHSLRADLKVEDLGLQKASMQFLYDDETSCVFMDPQSAEQVEVPRRLLGDRARFLTPEMNVVVEFLGDQPVGAQMDDFLEVRIADTAPPVHQGGNDSTWKAAQLENGVEIQVPQFIKTGDSIRLDLNSMKYMDRSKTASR